MIGTESPPLAPSCREDEVDDVLAHLVVAAGDPHLAPGDAVAAVGLSNRPSGDVGQRGAGTRLGEAHRAEEATGDHRSHPLLDLLGGAVGREQVGVGNSQQGVGARADVRRLEPAVRGLRHNVGQLHPAEVGVELAGEEARFAECVECFLDRGEGDHLSRGRPIRLVGVAQLVVRSEPVDRQVCGQVEDRVERLPGMVAVALACAQ
jgi:hypothetical protein